MTVPKSKWGSYFKVENARVALVGRNRCAIALMIFPGQSPTLNCQLLNIFLEQIGYQIGEFDALGIGLGGEIGFHLSSN